MSTSTSESGTDTSKKAQNDSICDKVHSANSWETADLGDKQRNEKFLRLMGASKKEHHGKIVIGEKSQVHNRDKLAEAHLQEELEEQFSQGMEHRLAGGKKGHLGLGFHTDDKGDANKKEEQESTDTSRDKETAAPTDCPRDGETEQGPDESHKDKSDDHSREKDERKRESSDKDGAHEIKKLKFVKSSS